MKALILLIGLVAITLGSFAQVGINTTAPDSSAVLDLNANNKGLLIPTMTTTQREAMQVAPPVSGLADGLLVFDTDKKRFYFWDIDVSKWVVVNNWRKEYTSDSSDEEHVTVELDSNSNVGIGEVSPASKLTVNGNLSIGSNIAAPTNGAFVYGQVRIGSGAGTTAKLEVEGTTITTDSITAPNFWGRGTVPVGFIGMYSGSTDASLFDGTGKGIVGSKMEGWAICNGNNGTPNLRGRFIVGSTSGPNNNAPINASEINKTYNVEDTGGENSHTLSIAEMPRHNHSIDDPGHSHNYTKYNNLRNHIDFASAGASNYLDKVWNHTTSGTTNPEYTGISINYTGNDQPHENRPPYYAVYYIMRIY